MDGREGVTYGRIAEERVLHQAAWGGQPDFVFRPALVKKGGAQREIGDALIWTGSRVLIVAVKARDPSAKGKDSEARARSWLDKAILKASRQVDGTIRALEEEHSEIILTNLRGVSVPWTQSDVEEWMAAVVVDYTPPSGYVPAASSMRVPGAVLHAEDWRVINETLWSATLTAGYINTRSQLPPVPMGAELDLLGHVLEAEQSALPVTLPQGLPEPGKWEAVRKRYPDIAMRSHPDAEYGTPRVPRRLDYVDATVSRAAC